MPKTIPQIDRFAIAKASLDTPATQIAKDYDVNVVTVRAILGEEEIKEFIARLTESRKQGFAAAVSEEAHAFAQRLLTD